MDLENDENVETEGQRRKLFNWFMKALLKCGGASPIFIYIGTILNYSAMLYKVLHEAQFAMWDRKIYKAVYKFSDCPLWDDWEKIITSINLIDDEEKQKAISKDAFDFYRSNREAMLENVVCLWPEKEEDYYYNLMVEKVMDEESFNSEEQNDPMTDDLRDFKEQWLIENTYIELPEITEYYGAVDPTIVASKQSDTSAIIILGRGIDNKIYVIEADVKKRKAEDVIEDMIYIIVKYYDKLQGFVVEANCMQQFFANTVKQKFEDLQLYVKWIEVKHPQGDSKPRRIKSMTQWVKNGYIKFNKNHTKLWSQLKNYPKDADDAPDALQMALEPMLGLSGRTKLCFESLSMGSHGRNGLNISSLMNRRRW
jgi:predicted phage terminase large subunit-like protein